MDSRSNHSAMKVERTHSLLDALPDPAFLVNERREIVASNRAVQDKFGAMANGRDLALAIRHPNVLEAVDKVLAGARAGEAILELTAPLLRVFEVHVAALSASPDDNARALCTLRDITVTREVERMRADFVANVSHELRSPLTALTGFVETLKGPARDDVETRSRFLDIMDIEARRMARLVDDLLSLSRVEAREHLPPMEEVDVTELLRGVAATIGPRASERDIEILLDLGSCPAPIRGDRDELVEMFHNLVDNAVKYGRAATPVTVRTRAKTRIPDLGGVGISIAIVNLGELIGAEHLPRLTERFYRADKGRSRVVGGTGLGLAIVKHIVNRHRGLLSIESTAEIGNVFTVYLPMTDGRDEFSPMS